MNPNIARLENQPVRIAILLSGRGANAMAIIRAVADGTLRGCEIGVVVSNITGAPGLEAAKTMGVAIVTLEGRGRDQRDHENAVSALLRKFRIDLICMAGYRRALSAGFVREWSGRILNMQASLLPAYAGSGPALQAIEGGAQITGCTVLFVGESTTGPIVLQRAVDVLDDDTEEDLKTRLLPEQHAAYIEALRRVISGDYEVRGLRYVQCRKTASQDTGADTEARLLEPVHDLVTSV